MRKLLLLLATMAVSLPAAAGGSYGWSVGYGQGYGHYWGGYRPHHGYHHGYRHHYRHHRRHDRYAAIAGGLILGAVIHGIVSDRREPVYERRVVSRRPVAAPAVEPVPAAAFDRYFRIESDGSCWLIERQEDGNLIATEQERSICR
ncbi:MAG: hypothetical protein R3200_10400 [Xanthomonadales bacterium]|nr:hypothetical protein [Xanthomonadales bacterium]